MKQPACASPFCHGRPPFSLRIPFRIDPDWPSLANTRLFAPPLAPPQELHLSRDFAVHSFFASVHSRRFLLHAGALRSIGIARPPHYYDPVRLLLSVSLLADLPSSCRRTFAARPPPIPRHVRTRRAISCSFGVDFVILQTLVTWILEVSGLHAVGSLSLGLTASSGRASAPALPPAQPAVLLVWWHPLQDRLLSFS